VEPRGPAARELFVDRRGRGEMTKAPISLQDLRRRIYVKAKAEPSWRFWGLYGHVCKRETLLAAYRLAKKNNGAPGIDGVTFEAVEAQGVDQFVEQLREELVRCAYRPLRVRKVGIPKEGGRVRDLSIPAIRDRVVQGALKLILEPIFEADFQPGSFGYRPKKTPHEAIERAAKAILQRNTYVIDFDLRSYFDTVRHHILLGKVARRVGDGEVLHLLRLILRSSGKRGVPQGGVMTPPTQTITRTRVPSWARDRVPYHDSFWPDEHLFDEQTEHPLTFRNGGGFGCGAQAHEKAFEVLRELEIRLPVQRLCFQGLELST
jgi:RNA-directed DNA polymerase